jgi:RNA recognition motif-containing protein
MSLFVGNLTWDTTSEDLERLFASYDDLISAEVVTSSNGRSRGYGLVKFSSDASVHRAVSELNGATVDDRVIEVREDRGPTPRQTSAPASSSSSSNSSGLFVGNLTWETQSEDLQRLLSSYDDLVSAEIVTSNTGRSRGYGLVQFSSEASVQRAIEELNGATVDGRVIEVREDRGATKRSPKPRASPRTRSSDTPSEVEPTKVFVGNLAWSVTSQALAEHFGTAGEVVEATVMERRDGKSKGCGVVEFATPAEAQTAIAELTDTLLDEREMFVREYRK